MAHHSVVVPTRDDARRAADELVAAGASQVLLFGSVARGDARAESDIDLVAVFDDLDYTQRLSLKLSLRATAEAAAGWPVEVYVTDRAEWARRSCGVSASLEARIAPDAVTLVDCAGAAVRWDKGIGLPSTNISEALGRDGGGRVLTWSNYQATSDRAVTEYNLG